MATTPQTLLPSLLTHPLWPLLHRELVTKHREIVALEGCLCFLPQVFPVDELYQFQLSYLKKSYHREQDSLYSRRAQVESIPPHLVHLTTLKEQEALCKEFLEELERAHNQARSRQGQPKKKRLTERQKQLLEACMNLRSPCSLLVSKEQPYPSSSAKEYIAFKCDMLPIQVNYWFANHRRNDR
jgi:hypothetical protein